MLASYRGAFVNVARERLQRPSALAIDVNSLTARRLQQPGCIGMITATSCA
jgi:hypothetical protein